jgi:hypothetical protein
VLSILKLHTKYRPQLLAATGGGGYWLRLRPALVQTDSRLLLDREGLAIFSFLNYLTRENIDKHLSRLISKYVNQ